MSDKWYNERHKEILRVLTTSRDVDLVTGDDDCSTLVVVCKKWNQYVIWDELTKEAKI
jgi:hypothetical protein